ncbi:MAG: diguanylate cyclase [Acidiferrobacterales bacterium]
MSLTIRNRLFLALAGMLVPLAILSITIFAFLNQTADIVQETLVDPIAEVNETTFLKNLLYQAAMPASDYLVHGSFKERVRFRQLEEKIEKQFSHLKSSRDLPTNQKQLLAQTYGKWTLANEMSSDILQREPPLDHRLGAATQERLEGLFRHATDLVDKMHSNAEEALRKGAKLSGQGKKRIEKTTIYIILIGLSIMLIIEYLVVRSILRPLQKLEDGVLGIAKGDYDRQVSIDTDDEFGRLAASFNDMATNLKKAHTELEQLSMQDGLTGILNRRALEQALESEAARARRFGKEFSLVIFDIDNFKKVNDTYGHLFGDDVLIAIIREVEKHMRPVDVFGRYGGEEFVIIMPETGIEGAAASTERLRGVIEYMNLKDEHGQDVPVSASFGVACSSEGIVGNDLLELADKRLYHAKAEGRNKVISSGSELGSD